MTTVGGIGETYCCCCHSFDDLMHGSNDIWDID
jgi:hypothetical protein